MIPINRTYAPLQALVDELARCGMRHAVTSPGSRNAPIALTLAADERIDAVSIIDERAAGFMALGMAKASGLPVAVTCTSGTAAANLLPAVVEAREARVPLIVLTADRPPELRDVGAGQAIDQIELFGSAAKWFVEVGNGPASSEWAMHMRALACRAWSTAAGGRPGAVHLNLPLREPLAPAPEDIEPGDWQGRADGRPWVDVREHSPAPDAGDVQSLAERIALTPRGAVVCGPAAGGTAGPAGRPGPGGAAGIGEPAARLAAAAGWPLLADPLSGARCGAHDRSRVIAHYDPLLGTAPFAEAQRPDLVLRLGDTPTSKPLRAWLAGAAQVVVDPHGAWHEPTRAAETIVQADPGRTCDALATALEARELERDVSWVASWRAADAQVAPALATAPDGFEGRAYAELERVLPEGALVWLSSSMPVRYVESYFPQSGRQIRFMSNRGANGIDGVVSSAAGAARATRVPTFLLIGELALLHDLGGLIAAARAQIELTIVCVNNGGGGIFDYLPVAEHADATAYERHVATPAGVDLGTVAALAGLEHRLAATAVEVRDAVGAGPGLIELRTDRAAAVRASRDVAARVAARLA